MNRSLDRSRILRLRHRILAGLLSVGALAVPATSGAFSGVANDLHVTALTGWTQCYLDTYNNNGLTAAGVLAACTGDNLMLACRPTGSGVLTVAAHAPRADVTLPTLLNTPHPANGVGWYFGDNFSWGFAAQGDAINQNKCDVASANGGQRVCWHTQQALALGGYRCGTAVNLNSSPSFERVVYQADSDPNTCTPADDADNDGICQVDDNCPATINHDQTDTDSDGQGDACDPCPFDADDDIDGDGVCGDVDNCIDVPNSDQADADGDSIGDACDTCTDPDFDGFGNPDATSCPIDNCPAIANPGQEDLDDDAEGDVCDASDATGLSITRISFRKSTKASADVWNASGGLDASTSPTIAADIIAGGASFSVRNQAAESVGALSFTSASCTSVGKGGVKCTDANRSSLKLAKRSNGEFRVSVTARKQTLASLPAVPADAPFGVTLTSPVSIDRNDTAGGACTSTASAVKCKE